MKPRFRVYAFMVKLEIKITKINVMIKANLKPGNIKFLTANNIMTVCMSCHKNKMY